MSPPDRGAAWELQWPRMPSITKSGGPDQIVLAGESQKLKIPSVVSTECGSLCIMGEIRKGGGGLKWKLSGRPGKGTGSVLYPRLQGRRPKWPSLGRGAESLGCGR